MELREALSQISEIRGQIARSQIFRGYRSVTAGFSALMAMIACLVQAWWLPDPSHNMRDYLRLWFAAAVLSLIVVAAEMIFRYRRTASELQREITLHAVEQFIPCLVAGALLTFVLQRFATHTLWMLPGLWAIVFSLGIFASRRMLPRASKWVAGYYLIAGLVAIALAAQNGYGYSPWQMAGTFGAGQLITSAMLYITLERRHV